MGAKTSAAYNGSMCHDGLLFTHVSTQQTHLIQLDYTNLTFYHATQAWEQLPLYQERTYTRSYQSTQPLRNSSKHIATKLVPYKATANQHFLKNGKILTRIKIRFAHSQRSQASVKCYYQTLFNYLRSI
eukprot:2386998-Amphidinium_carterae.1